MVVQLYLPATISTFVLQALALAESVEAATLGITKGVSTPEIKTTSSDLTSVKPSLRYILLSLLKAAGYAYFDKCCI